MNVDAAAVRQIADRLESAEQLRDDAVNDLRALLNGTHAEAVRVDRTPADQAGERGSDAHPPLHDQVPEAPPVATPEAGLDTPTESSGTDDRPRGGLVCRKCGRAFPRGTGIRQHERWCKGPGQGGVAGKRQVRSEGTFACADCDSSFPSAQARGAHRRYKHGIRGKASDGEAPPLRAHSYLCDRCDRAFSNTDDLATHRLSHPAPPKVQPVGDRPPVGFARGTE